MNSTNPLLVHESDKNYIQVNYYWYHHMLLNPYEQGYITKAIDDGDFYTFEEYCNQYGEFCFPRTASIIVDDNIIGEIDVHTPEGFALITFNECECG